jgi:hypothetical protein
VGGQRPDYAEFFGDIKMTHKVYFSIFLFILLCSSCINSQVGEKVSSEPPPSTLTPDFPPSIDAKTVNVGWKIYHNETYGYQFEYPADTQIIVEDDHPQNVQIVGPVIEDNQWPLITISHPSDREDFLPPEDVDLGTWLDEHNLLEGGLPSGVQIAGQETIHQRYARSPQSFAYDRFAFAKSGQLYMIVIGHGGDKEDWVLYYHFLQSFQFDR